MKKLIAIFLILFLQGIDGKSQSGDQMDSLRRAQAAEFGNFKSSINQEYQNYIDSINREFSSYLREIWPEHSLAAGAKPDSSPKPTVLPRYSSSIEKLKPISVPILITKQPPAIAFAPFIVPPAHIIPTEEKATEENPGEKVIVDYYGTSVDFFFDPKINGNLPREGEIHNTTVADFWDRMNSVNSAGLVRQMNETKSQMNLNDWGYYMLVRKTSENINPDTNYSRLLTWFLLTKSGYRIRVAFKDNRIVLMFPATSAIYNIKYFVNNDVKFYAPDCKLNTIFTYERDFPGATKIFDMNIYSPLNIGEKYSDRQFKFSYQEKEHSFKLKYNVNSIDFYKDYPLCDLKVYFDAVATTVTRESIINSLRPEIERLSLKESVEFLLRFVQNGFSYQTDPEQFGKEKFDFPEEILYYPNADCDDRAVFFSYLVKELTGLKVIGVLYPGHVANAVCFPGEEQGDFINYKGEKYIIADPTYLEAPVGLTMPGKANSQAAVIELLNKQGRNLEIASIWEKAMTGGGFQGDNQMNAVTDNEGNTFITGYYKGQAVFGETSFFSNDSSEHVFIAKYDRAGNVVWAKKGTDGAKGRGYNINLDKDDNIYICGTFEELMAFGSFNIVFSKGKSGLFLLKLNKGGETEWLRQADFKTETEGMDMILFSEFSSRGEILKSEVFPYDPDFVNYGIRFDTSGNIYYAASYSTTLGLKIDRIAVGLDANFDPIFTLKDETDKQMSANCEAAIAGLFAAINLIKLDNVSLSGKSVQMALNRYNPRFISNCPKIYGCLGKLSLIKNCSGIVTVQTDDHKAVSLDKIKISDGTRFRIITMPNGDARVDILSGVKVGKAVFWYELNFIRLYRANGNIMFDYSTDHSQITLNMRKDLLN